MAGVLAKYNRAQEQHSECCSARDREERRVKRRLPYPEGGVRRLKRGPPLPNSDHGRGNQRWEREFPFPSEDHDRGEQRSKRGFPSLNMYPGRGELRTKRVFPSPVRHLEYY